MASESFEHVIAEGVELQQQLPWLEMVAVGGSAAAIHARHRYSTDVDHVTMFLRDKFDVVESRLEEWEDWKTNRVNRPVLVLGERHGVELGVRQQRRTVPLELVERHGLIIPTASEALRIKAFLATQRQATRDFLDIAALVDHLGLEESVRSLSYLNQIYDGKGNQTAITRFAEVMEQPPTDLARVDLSSYRGIRPPYDAWEYVRRICQMASRQSLVLELERDLPSTLDGYADPTKLQHTSPGRAQ